MDLYWLDYLWTVLLFAATAFVVVRLLASSSRVRQFPVFVAYALWQLASTTAYWAFRLAWGETEWLYSVYQVFQIVALASITAVLVDIYYKLKQRSDWSHWIGLLTFVVGVAVLAQQSSSYYFALVTVFMLFNCALALIVQWMRLRSGRIDLGLSYTRILFGLSLMLAFQTFIYSYSILGVGPFPAWMLFLAQPVSIAGWLWFVAAVSRIDLPRTIEEMAEEPVGVELGLVRHPERVVAE